MYASMRASIEADRQVEPNRRCFTPSTIPCWTCWGLLFLRMVNLKTLTIEFETSEDKKSEMETIVDWAHKRWRFPVLRRLSGDSRDPFTFDHLQRSHSESPVDLSPWSEDLDVLSAADEPVQKTSWRGFPHHLDERCQACRIMWRVQNATTGCAECTKKQRLLALDMGPQLLVWTVTWKRKVPPTDPEPEVSIGGESNQDRGGQPRPSRAPGGRQGRAGPSSPAGMDSHVLAMLPEDAQYRTRRRRELNEILTRKVAF